MLTRYSSNNSGGYWWLTDEHWKDLEAAGWRVMWNGHIEEYDAEDNLVLDESGLPKILVDEDKAFSKVGERWLGALATSAYRALPIDEAKAEFARITGEDPDAEGCHCCGQPHYFREAR